MFAEFRSGDRGSDAKTAVLSLDLSQFWDLFNIDNHRRTCASRTELHEQIGASSQDFCSGASSGEVAYCIIHRGGCGKLDLCHGCSTRSYKNR